MKTYIVEDSRLARKELKRMLQQINGIEIVGESGNVDDAVQEIEKLTPDLILLDIQMPEKNGFDLLNELVQVPQVIFVTAYDEYAVQAFEVNALDYLTKPVEFERLKISVEKARQRFEELDMNRGLLSEDSRVFVKEGEKCWFVRVGNINLFRANGNYTKIFFQKGSPSINKSLTYLEERLDSNLFFRANRNEIINLKRIKSVDPWFSNTIKITMEDGTEIEASRRQSRQFRQMMSF